MHYKVRFYCFCIYFATEINIFKEFLDAELRILPDYGNEC